MRSSSYYYNLWNQHRTQSRKYQGWIDELTPIKSRLENNFNDDVNRVNKEIDELQEDLKNSVRMNDIFTSNAEELDNKKEKNAKGDSRLSAAISSIGDELTSLRAKKAEEDRAADQARRDYERALEEERREAEEALKRAASALIGLK